MSQKKRRLIYILVVFTLLFAGFSGSRFLKSHKNNIKKKRPEILAPMVRTVEVRAGKQSISISGEGTVRPLNEISLVPQVGGKIQYVAPFLVNGGAFKKGDTLLRIESIDYELAVTLDACGSNAELGPLPAVTCEAFGSAGASRDSDSDGAHPRRRIGTAAMTPASPGARELLTIGCSLSVDT